MKTQTQLQCKKTGCTIHYPKKKKKTKPKIEGLSACLRYHQLPFINSNYCALVIPGDAQTMEPSARLEQRWIPGTHLNSPLIIDNISLTPYKPGQTILVANKYNFCVFFEF